MKILYFNLFLIVALLTGGYNVRGAETEEISQAIKAKYDAILYQLKPSLQRHYAERMYRISGNDDYLYPIIFDFLISVEELRCDITGIDDTSFSVKRKQQLLSQFNRLSTKGRKRFKLFDKLNNDIINLKILENTYRVTSRSVEDSSISELCQRSIRYLKGIDFESILLNKDIIREYAAQAVNAVYYLHRLGIADLRSDYKLLFRKTFPDKDDFLLSSGEFRNKVYGLTHFILAASDYYQHPVDSNEFGWILHYYEKRAGRILSETKPDIVAEVGICFLLSGSEQNPLLKNTRQYIINSFSVTDSMILSTRGSSDIQKGEHRNILAYMLLSWPRNLTAGPFLGKMEKYNQLFISFK